MDNSYFDAKLETPGKEVCDVLWRAVHSKRGGRRGYSQKVRHLTEGLESGVYFNKYPWVSQEGRTYSERWGYRISDTVLQGSETWEIQSSDEEEEVILVEEPEKKTRSVESAGKAKAPVISKAVTVPSSSVGAVPKCSSSVGGAIPEATAAQSHSSRVEEETSFPKFSEGGSSSSRAGSRPKIAAKARPKGSGARSTSEPAAAKELPVSRLKPRTTVLPDTVLWFDRTSSADKRFIEVKKYSDFDGYRNYQSTSDTSRGFPKFILFVDWHQCLDRSPTEGSWNNRFPADSITFLKSIKKSAKEVWGHEDAIQILVLSHIEESSKNLANVINTCNTLKPIRSDNLITAIFITRHRTGCLGKGAVIEAYTQNLQLPCAIVDDNVQVIQDCANREVHTAHVKVRRKPWSEEAEVVKNYLLDTAEPLKRLFERYR